MKIDVKTEQDELIVNSPKGDILERCADQGIMQMYKSLHIDREDNYIPKDLVVMMLSQLTGAEHNQLASFISKRESDDNDEQKKYCSSCTIL